jgi:Sec-independent protein translocase protein TatA
MLILFSAIAVILATHAWTELFSAFGNLLGEFFNSISSVKSLHIRFYEHADGKKILEKFIEIPFEIFIIVFLLIFTPRIKKLTNLFKNSDKVKNSDKASE